MGNRDAHLPRCVEYEKQFIKDWLKLSRSERFDMRRLHEAMMLLVANIPMGAEWRDHPLKGRWRNHRECHIGGDFLLVYRFSESRFYETVIFVRAGTHAELFE